MLHIMRSNRTGIASNESSCPYNKPKHDRNVPSEQRQPNEHSNLGKEDALNLVKKNPSHWQGRWTYPCVTLFPNVQDPMGPSLFAESHKSSLSQPVIFIVAVGLAGNHRWVHQCRRYSVARFMFQQQGIVLQSKFTSVDDTTGQKKCSLPSSVTCIFHHLLWVCKGTYDVRRSLAYRRFTLNAHHNL